VEAPVVGSTIEKGIEIRQRSMTLGSWEISTLKTAFDRGLEAHLGSARA
jgi:hypothetical protein